MSFRALYPEELSGAVQANMAALAARGGAPQYTSASDNITGGYVECTFNIITDQWYGTANSLHETFSLAVERTSRQDLAIEPMDTLSGVVGEKALERYSHISLVDIWKYCVGTEKGERLNRTLLTKVYGLGHPDAAPVELTTLPMAKKPRREKIGWWEKRRQGGSSFLDYAEVQLDLQERLIPSFRAFGIEPVDLVSLWHGAKDPRD